MIDFIGPSVRRTGSELDFESSSVSQPSFEDQEQLHHWVLNRLRSKPHMTRVTFDFAGRVDLAVPVQLIPIDSEFRLLSEQAVNVEVTELSKTNLVIQHRELLRNPDAVVVLRLRDGTLVPARVRFTRTRFRGPGSYQSGGRFVVGPLVKERDACCDLLEASHRGSPNA